MKYKEFKKLNEGILNEAEDNPFLAYFMSIKSFMVLSSTWPAAYTKKKDLEYKQAMDAVEYDIEQTEAMMALDTQLKDQEDAAV